MRRGLVAAAIAGLLVAVVPASPALADRTDDACGDALGNDLVKDLAAASFTYSATSFSVATTACKDLTQPNGSWSITFHLEGFGQPVQVSGLLIDYAKVEGWTGYGVCAGVDCSPRPQSNGSVNPAGVPIDGPAYQRPSPYSPGRTAVGWGAWSDVLPAGTTVPDSISWWVEVHSVGYDGTDLGLLDRVPDAGLTTTARGGSTPTRLTVTPGPAPTFGYPTTFRTDRGTLTAADGSPVTGRLVLVRPPVFRGSYDDRRTDSDGAGDWTATYDITRNTDLTAYFPGDGVHDPVRSAPYRAYVKAFVSLDLKASTSVPRGTSLRLKGVVRPRQGGQVQILVREDKPGTTYRVLRYSELIQDRGDSYYDIRWAPSVRGRYVLRARWNGGSTAVGAVLSNVSTYRFVSVT